jgi:hypothetical protein
MPQFFNRWSEIWRVLAYTAAIALAFVALGRLEMTLFWTFGAGNRLALEGSASSSAEAAFAREAQQVAAQSRDALARRPGHRLAAFRIGYELGYASAFMGSYESSPIPVQAKARTIGERHLAIARQQGVGFDVTGLAELPVHNLTEYVTLNDRFEADENGLAARVEQRLSPLHRHLYLLGAHVGGEASIIESSGGKLTQPPVVLIRRHAMLAGVDPALWLPLALEPRGETPAQVLNRYRSALNALGADLAARDAGSDAPASPR